MTLIEQLYIKNIVMDNTLPFIIFLEIERILTCFVLVLCHSLMII